MPKQSINTLKNWFKRGLKPLEVQFADWLDSYWHKDATNIPIAAIQDLQTILNGFATDDAIIALLDGVPAPGNTLNKLYELIDGLTTDDVAEGVTNKYFTAARVLSAPLAGVSESTGVVVDGDTVIVAFSKLQNTKVSVAGSYADPSWITSLSAAKITGVLNIANIPAAALERIYTYTGAATLPENAGLTTSNVQNGDIVKMNTNGSTPNGLMYVVINDANLSTSASFVQYSAGYAASVPWSGVTATPTTLAGYGITNAWNAGSGATLTANNTIATAGNDLFYTSTRGFGSAISLTKWTNNGNDITNLTTLGTQSWNIYSTAASLIGSVSISSPGNSPGFIFINGSHRYDFVHSVAGTSFNIVKNAGGATFVRIGNATATNTATLIVTGAGTTSALTFRTEDSGGNAQFTVTDAGALATNAESVRGLSIVSSGTLTNEVTINLSGTVTIGGTTNSGVRHNMALTTGATSQVLTSFRSDASYTINHTGATIYGFYYGPSVAGSQTATEYSFFATRGRAQFATTSVTAGVNVGTFAGDPGTLSNADIWYNSSSHQLSARINGATVNLGTAGALSGLTAAVASNTIDNDDHVQTWNWNPINADGLVLHATSTVSADQSKLFKVTRDGAHGGSSIASYSGYFTNTHTGTTSTNVAVYASASGATVNYAIDIATGHLRIQSVANTAIVDTNGNEILKFAFSASAVNEFTIANGATGVGPKVSVTGGDSNIDFLVDTKGTGALVVGGGNNAVFRGATGKTMYVESGAADQLVIRSGPNGSGSTSAIQIYAGGASGGVGGSVYIMGGPSSTHADGNVAFGTATSPGFQSMENGIFIANAVTIPTGNPTGGIFMYPESGALKVRGTSGTITTVAPADPHCPVCGSDFVHEWESELYGYLAVCMKCVSNSLGNVPFISTTKGNWHKH